MHIGFVVGWTISVLVLIVGIFMLLREDKNVIKKKIAIGSIIFAISAIISGFVNQILFT